MVSLMLDDTSYLLLVILKCYGRPMERLTLHRHLYRILERTGLKLDLKFYGKPPFSPQVEEKVEELINKGLLKRLYMVGPLYTELYREYVRLTEKGREVLDSVSPKGFEEEIEQYFEEVRAKSRGEKVERSVQH